MTGTKPVVGEGLVFACICMYFACIMYVFACICLYWGGCRPQVLCPLYCLYRLYWYVFICIRHVFVCIVLVNTSSFQTNTNIQTNTNTIQTRKICMYCVRRVYVLCMYLCVLILKTWIISWNRLFRGICTSQWILTVSAVITATESFIFHASLSQYGMIWWPDHGPRVDVEEFAPGSWRIGSVTCALREVRLLLACHWKRNGSSVAYGYQRNTHTGRCLL